MKELVLHCPLEVIRLIRDAIQLYAHAAYPPGGSECAQSAREAMLSTAEKLLREYDVQTGTSRLSRRIRTHVNAAVEYYFEQQIGDSQVQQDLVKRVLAGETVTQAQWPI